MRKKHVIRRQADNPDKHWVVEHFGYKMCWNCERFILGHDGLGVPGFCERCAKLYVIASRWGVTYVGYRNRSKKSRWTYVASTLSFGSWRSLEWFQSLIVNRITKQDWQVWAAGKVKVVRAPRHG